MSNKTDLYKLDHTRKTQRLPLMKLLLDASASLVHINFYFFRISNWCSVDGALSQTEASHLNHF